MNYQETPFKCKNRALPDYGRLSGRNEITDFEDVVKLDVQYYDNWSLGLDIKIILKTIKVVFEKGGE